MVALGHESLVGQMNGLFFLAVLGLAFAAAVIPWALDRYDQREPLEAGPDEHVHHEQQALAAAQAHHERMRAFERRTAGGPRV